MNNEFRRARRRKVQDRILVTDTMTEAVVGSIGNLSETGLLLLASKPLVEDALYQLRFYLPNLQSRVGDFEIGAHLLWQDRANAPGQFWTGFRFIAVPSDQGEALRKWIDSPGAQYE